MFDIRPLCVVMVAIPVVLAASMWIGTGRRLRGVPRSWTASLAAQAACLTLFAGRGMFPDRAAIVAGNALLSASFPLAGRIRKSVAKASFWAGGVEIPLTASAGVAARIDEGPEGLDRLVGAPDEVLSIAKNRGRNRVAAVSLGRPRVA